MKTCTVCKEDKSLDNFYNYKAKADGKSYRCKSCDDLARKRWRYDNPERSKLSARSRQIKHKYGLTLDDYESLLKQQDYCCAICECSTDSPRVQGSMAVDHCHNTGKIRGLLCNQCNRAIGMLDDSPTLLKKSYRYLTGGNFLKKLLSKYYGQ